MNKRSMTKSLIQTGLGAMGVAWAARGLVRRWLESRYSLRGRVVLITGGSRGLGLLLAREYARRGARLALIARDAAALERAGGELGAQGVDVLGIPCDVSDETRVFDMVERVVLRFGRLDLIVNGAGQIQVGPLEAMTVRDFRAAMDANFWGAFNVIN